MTYVSVTAPFWFPAHPKNTIADGGSTAMHSKAKSGWTDGLDPTQKASPIRASSDANNIL